MKKIVILFTLSALLASCDENVEPILYDNVNGQVGVSFLNNFISVVVPEEGTTASVPVQVTTVSNVDRMFSVSVNEASTASSADYSLGNIVIPANEYEGTLTVTFDNFDGLADLTTFNLILDLSLEPGQVAVGAASTTFSYVKEVVCNDLTLTIAEDNYADERDWQITDSTGAIVVQCSDYDNCPNGAPSGSIPPATYNYDFNLPDGCYTFTILDAFGDGLADGSVTGNYELKCSIIIHAFGEGNFGGQESTDFCVNQ